MNIDLSGKVSIVTGSASGIGKGIAAGLARSKSDVAIADINIDGAKATATELAKAHGVRAVGVKMDVTNKASIEQAVAEVVQKLGRIDILVNNAGIAPSYSLVDFPEDKWDLTIAINMKGYFLVAQAVVRQMLKQGEGGNIINISSKTGVRGSSDNSAYNASKFGVIGLAQGWSRELAKHKIRVNSVLPGNVLRGSGIWNEEYKRSCAKKYGIKPEEVEDYYNKQVPLGRQCSVEDIANMVVFLVSDYASYITGCSHLVDGGQEMR
ncbi:MAG: glucose 1-dehydrogenase [Planctomycetota bacterium]